MSKIKTYFKQQEAQVPVDHKFLKHLEKQLFPKLSFWQRIYLPKFSFALAGALAVLLLALILNFKFNNKQSQFADMFYPKTVIAESIKTAFGLPENNFQVGTGTDFIYRELKYSDPVVKDLVYKIWSYNGNMRFDFITYDEVQNIFSELISVKENLLCANVNIISIDNTYENEAVCNNLDDLLKHFVSLPEVILPATESIVVQTKLWEQGIVVVWATNEPTKESFLIYDGKPYDSMPGPFDNDPEQYTNKFVEGKYWHSVKVYHYPEEAQTVYMQIQSNGTAYSDIYFYDYTTQTLTKKDYAALLAEARIKMQAENVGLEQYRELITPALFIAANTDLLDEPIINQLQTDGTRYLRFKLNDNIKQSYAQSPDKNDMFMQEGEYIDFILLNDLAYQLKTYSVLDEQGQELLKLEIVKDEQISDIEAGTFFTKDNWMQDLGFIYTGGDGE